jgi:hypothetical protein
MKISEVEQGTKDLDEEKLCETYRFPFIIKLECDKQEPKSNE